MKSKYLINIIIIIFLIHRLTIVFFSGHLIHDIDGATIGSTSLAKDFWGNEVYDKNIFLDLTNRSGDRISAVAGKFITNIVYLLFATIFGDSFLHIKIITILFSFVGLLFWLKIINKFESKKTTLIFGIIYIFAPYLFLKWNLTLWSSHPESIAFTAILTYIWIKYLKSNTKKNAALVGIIAGISFSFSIFTAIPLLTIGIISLFKYKKKFTKTKIIIIIMYFFLLGIMPLTLIFLNAYNPNMNIHNTPEFKPDISEPVTK